MRVITGHQFSLIVSVALVDVSTTPGFVKLAAARLLLPIPLIPLSRVIPNLTALVSPLSCSGKLG